MGVVEDFFVLIDDVGKVVIMGVNDCYVYVVVDCSDCECVVVRYSIDIVYIKVGVGFFLCIEYR